MNTTGGICESSAPASRLLSAPRVRPLLGNGVAGNGANDLTPIFAPKAIAVIGASERAGGLGASVFQNLAAFNGPVYPVNPKYSRIFRVRCFRTVAAIHAQVDLAIIAAPAAAVPSILAECGQAQIRAAVILSAGFKECGLKGAGLEQQVLAAARRYSIRVIGPNCLGVMVPGRRFNGTFAAGCAVPGQVAFLSQSGALCTAVLDWSIAENVGFSAFVSVGSMADVGWGDLISYFGSDPDTKSILIYMESVGDAKRFLRAARTVGLRKPIIVVKAGRTDAGAKAAASHTGSITGSDEVLEAAFERAGVLRVNTVEELFDMAEVLAKQPAPRGSSLAIVTNGGGPGALAADTLVSTGGRLAPLSGETQAALDAFLPPYWSHGNPIDVLGDASADTFGKAVDLALKDPATDAVLAILTPQSMTDATGTAKKLVSLAKKSGKPLLTSWMGGNAVGRGISILDAAGIATFEYPDRGARAFTYMSRYSANVGAVSETVRASKAAPVSTDARAAGNALIDRARKAERTVLSEFESKQILSAYDIPTTKTVVAFTEDDAVRLARGQGYPVVVKLYSETLTHKTEVDGVHLGVRNANGVRHAWRAIRSSVETRAGHQHFLGVTIQPMVARSGYELILGSSIDRDFGPVLLFGAGGQLVEVFDDHALALPPLTPALALRLIERTRIHQALKGVRGRPPVDIECLARLMVRFSDLVLEQRWIKEIDVNPLLAGPTSIVALDARIVLHAPGTPVETLPTCALNAS